ncbi:MAG: hypothetical protein HIU85_13985 [Proteobacteria bacterium]|nr:hypothetical protein [Pseudomonadota bacterium]
MDAQSPTNGRIRVWDLPTRLSHWTTVILFGVCWWTAQSDHMEWHRIAGYGVLGAVLFRLAWGFCGGQTARFRDFVRGPAATFRYVRKLFGGGGDESPPPLGHNPLGALSIIVMLGLLLTQTTLGLFAVNVDMRRGQSLVVWAIREGRQCARSVDQFLMGSSTLPR